MIRLRASGPMPATNGSQSGIAVCGSLVWYECSILVWVVCCESLRRSSFCS